MSGILNNKQRIIDAIMTLEGRRQLSEGDMRVEYYSFTDNGTRYEPDVNSGSIDVTDQIYLEASHLPQDQITFEADDSGRLKPFSGELDLAVKDGHIITHSFVSSSSALLTGSVIETSFLTGTEFASQASNLLGESINNFQKLRVISSKDRVFEDDGFGVSSNDVEFVIHDERPIENQTQWVANINDVESLFSDPRLGNVQNFQYLPPINKVIEDNVDKTDYRETSDYHLGRYPPWGRTHLFAMDYQQIDAELDYYADQGYCKTISFNPTSKNNKLMIQMFERSFSRLSKLDVIDYGLLRTGNPDSPLAHVFFIGKVKTDDNDTHSFIHLFTMVFE
jgi:hypothetical protein